MVDGLRRALAEEFPPPGLEGPTAAEEKKLRAAALRAALRGRPAPHHIMHDEAAAALMPRLYRWTSLASMSEAALRNGAAAALRALTGAAPAIWAAVVKSWTDGWPTAQRRGKGRHPCPVCSRADGDRVGHLVSCRRLTDAVADAAGLPPLQTVAAAIGVCSSHRVRPGVAAGFVPPESHHLFLALRLDTYQKAVGVRDFKAPFRQIGPAVLRGAPRHSQARRSLNSVRAPSQSSSARTSVRRCVAVHIDS